MADKQSEALRLADALETPTIQAGAFRHKVAAELRRLAAVEAERDALRAKNKALWARSAELYRTIGHLCDETHSLRAERKVASCSNTFDCQCPKHFASQQSEQRPKRVLTAVWRDRAQRAEAQRDALLVALKLIAATDPVDAALDPNRAARIAYAAIAKAERGGNG